MTDDRTFERAGRSFIEPGPTRVPERVVEAALLAIESTPQERDLRIPWRLSTMNQMTRLAAVAVVGAIALGGALYLSAGGQAASGHNRRRQPRDLHLPRWLHHQRFLHLRSSSRPSHAYRQAATSTSRLGPVE